MENDSKIPNKNPSSSELTLVPTSTSTSTLTREEIPVDVYLKRNKLEQLAVIGEGGFATVYKVKNLLDGKVYAAKVMKLSEEKSLWIGKCLKNEMYISKVLSHPNIIRTYNCFKTKTYAVIVMQFASKGSIRNELDARTRPYDESQALEYFAAVLTGLQHIHHMNIAHRDLKLENFLLDDNRRPMIADFGFATIGSRQRVLILDSILRSSICGSDGYMAPEIYRLSAGEQYNAKAADIYSMGVCFYEMLHQEFPYGKDPPTIQEIYERMNKQLIYFQRSVSPEIRDLIKSMLRVTPSERPNVAGIFNRLRTINILKPIRNIFRLFR